MISTLERLSDKLVASLLPNVEAQASACPTEEWSTGEHRCIGTAGYDRWCRQNSNCVITCSWVQVCFARCVC
jgi:hypothetical protein